MFVNWVCFRCPAEECGMAFGMSHHCKAHQQSRHGKMCAQKCH